MAAIGQQLNKKHNIGAEHALYRRDGTWFHHLKRFPGILCDEHGYVRFDSKADYDGHPGLQHGNDLHAPQGIASFNGYTPFPESAEQV